VQLAQPEAHAALDCTHRQPQHRSDLRVSETAEVGQVDHADLLLGQLLQYGADVLRILAPGHLDLSALRCLQPLFEPLVADVAGLARAVAAQHAEALKGVSFSDPHLKSLATKIASDEATHVAFLKKALGSHAVKKPKFDFGSAVTSQSMFAATSQALENTGVAAYFGQGFNISSKAYLADAISILTVEARHAGAIGFYNDQTAKAVSPEGAFDKPKTAGQVLSIVKGTHFIVG
jgi:hypothetical protein